MSKSIRDTEISFENRHNKPRDIPRRRNQRLSAGEIDMVLTEDFNDRWFPERFQDPIHEDWNPPTYYE